MTDQLHADQELVRELCEIDGGLSAWEVEFTESVAKQVETRTLTDKQRDIVERILRKAER